MKALLNLIKSHFSEIKNLEELYNLANQEKNEEIIA